MAEQGGMGIKWVDLTRSRDGAMKRREWSSTAPKWRETQHGLCLEGKCTTQSCDAYGSSIICNWGIGKEFNLGAHSPNVRCPICNRHVIPATCAFNNCDWKYRGKQWRSYAEGERKVEEGPFQAGNAYYVFDENVTTHWNKLKIETARMGEWCKGGGRAG